MKNSKDESLSVVDIEKLLDSNKSAYEFHDALGIGRKYFNKCADCIYPTEIAIIDPDKILNRFEEVYLAIQDIICVFNTELSERISKIETKLDLSQNIVRLGMISSTEFSKKHLLSNIFKSIEFNVSSIKLAIPETGQTTLNTELLLELKTALTRLAGLTSVASKFAKDWWRENEDVFVIKDFYDPRKTSKVYLKSLLDNVLSDLKEKPNNVPEVIKIELTKEIEQTIKELDKRKTSWNSVLSKIAQTVMVIGALVAIGANIDDAYENIKKAFNYISTEALAIPQLPRDQKPYKRNDSHSALIPQAIPSKDDDNKILEEDEF
ncbi:MAG: hypothetical protein OEZ22_15085 [Spirochaetia bacterium]|nr:hypothetical protein [Spirochaetia bacterium]